MARFVYNGEAAANPSLKGAGPALAFRFHTQNGTKVTVNAVAVGQEIGVDVQDVRVLRHLRHDPRFTEVPPERLAALSPPTLKV